MRLRISMLLLAYRSSIAPENQLALYGVPIHPNANAALVSAAPPCKPFDIDQNEPSPDPSPITATSATIGPTIAVMTISR
jgi:hypothetical protein